VVIPCSPAGQRACTVPGAADAAHGSGVCASGVSSRLQQALQLASAINAAVPPLSAGIFTRQENLNWHPGDPQLRKQGGWWLQSLVHYDSLGNVLHQHRVTAEIFLSQPVSAAAAGATH
jgi:hypothetical protein